VRRATRFTIFFDGRPIDAFAGETVATALLAASVRQLRSSPRAGTPRGFFCGMGICQECVVVVDGRTVPACLEPVRDGMQIVPKRYAT
jgi:sarcosine oxidase subunit alpha